MAKAIGIAGSISSIRRPSRVGGFSRVFICASGAGVEKHIRSGTDPGSSRLRKFLEVALSRIPEESTELG
jgi:hypothetical protein